MGRAPCCDKNGLKKGPWTPEEDSKLINYIQIHGHGNWRTLPRNSGLERCGKSCRLRWTNYLRPDIKRGRFSFEEEEIIIQLHRIMGNNWSTIAARLPGRTDNEIKNYWNTHIKKKLLRMGIDPLTQDLTNPELLNMATTLLLLKNEIPELVSQNLHQMIQPGNPQVQPIDPTLTQFNSKFQMPMEDMSRFGQQLRTKLFGSEDIKGKARGINLVKIGDGELTHEDFQGKKLGPNPTSLETLVFVTQVALEKFKMKKAAEITSSSTPPQKENNKRKSVSLDNPEISNEEWLKQFTDKKKSGERADPPSPLPSEFERQIIDTWGGDPRQITLIYKKTLYKSDVSKDLARLTMPLNNIETFKFLEEGQITLLRHGGAFNVPLLHKPRDDNGMPLPLTQTMLTLKQWCLAKRHNNCQRISYEYVLNGGWYKIVTDDQLQKDHTVHVWAFRDGQNKLCMALVKLE